MKNSIVIKVVRGDRSSLFAEGIYRLKYRRGVKVTAYEGSVGCMCFTSFEAADIFAKATHGLARLQELRYLQVEGIGDPHIPKWIAGSYVESAVRDFYVRRRGLSRPPKGTVCYPEVLVLD